MSAPRPLLDRVRDRLRADGVKLWLAPYTPNPPIPADTAPASIPPADLQSLGALAQKYSVLEECTQDEALSTLDSLRTHALEKLAERNRALIRTITIKHVGAKNSSGKTCSGTFQIRLDWLGHVLEAKLRDHMDLPRDQYTLKIILKGQLLHNDVPLNAQGYEGPTNIQLMVVATKAEAARVEDLAASKFAQTRDAASKFADRDEDGDHDKYFAEIQDQNGRPLNLPPAERRALVLAMTLQEKGKGRLRAGNVPEALGYFLEADREYRQCNSSILSSVDNVALLDLDVCWCYLSLMDLNSLPDAARRLDECERCLERTYGTNLEVVKRRQRGTQETAPELANYVRLYILKAALAYHNGNASEAHVYLLKAQQGLDVLAVDESLVMELCAMGATPSQARVALRRCGGNVDQAADWVLSENARRVEEERINREKRRKRRKQVRIGRTVGTNEWVDLDLLHRMVDTLGYDKDLSGAALRYSNNDLALAVTAIAHHPEDLKHLMPNKKEGKRRRRSRTPVDSECMEECLALLLSLGFDDMDAARAAVEASGGDIDAAQNILLGQPPTALPSTGTDPVDTSNNDIEPPRTHTPTNEDHASNDDEDTRLEDTLTTEIVDELLHTDTYEDVGGELQAERDMVAHYRALLASTTGY